MSPSRKRKLEEVDENTCHSQQQHSSKRRSLSKLEYRVTRVEKETEVPVATATHRNLQQLDANKMAAGAAGDKEVYTAPLHVKPATKSPRRALLTKRALDSQRRPAGGLEETRVFCVEIKLDDEEIKDCMRGREMKTDDVKVCTHTTAISLHVSNNILHCINLNNSTTLLHCAT